MVINESGGRTTGIVVSNVARWGKDDVELLSDRIGKSQVYEAHPQLAASFHMMSYDNINIDNTHPAYFRFWIGEDITILSKVILRYRINPFRCCITGYDGKDFEYGIYEESPADTLVNADLAICINDSGDQMVNVTDIGDGWYELDITSLLQNPATLRQYESNNYIVLSTDVNRSARITAQLSFNTIIQAIESV